MLWIIKTAGWEAKLVRVAWGEGQATHAQIIRTGWFQSVGQEIVKTDGYTWAECAVFNNPHTSLSAWIHF